MSAIAIILAHLLFQPVTAATFEVTVAEGDRLVIRGLEAQVRVVGQGGNSLKVSGVDDASTEGVFTVSKKNNIIEVKMKEYGGKKTWLNILKSQSQPRKIEISGLSVPTEVHLRNGSVTAQKWNKELKVNLSQGRFSSGNGSGPLSVYMQRGDVNVQDHTGKVEVDAYTGSVALKDIEGDVSASLFSGQLQIEKVRGFLALTTQQSNGKINQGSGTIQFENGRGNLNIQSFQGRLEGQNQEGTVNVTMTLDSEVDIRAKSGRVNVQVPPYSGMRLNLLTTEGDITVPSELKVARYSAERSVRGRLRGDAQRGSVFVRSQDGTISVK